MSTVTRVAVGATSGGTNASAIPCPSIGEKLPLVTSPTTVAVAQHRRALARRAGGPRRRARAAGGRRRARVSASSGARPRKSPLSQRTTQPRPACSGVMPGPSSWPCSGSPASRRSVSRAPSPAGAIAGAERPRPTASARRVGRHVDLDAVLAGVAGAGRDAPTLRPTYARDREPRHRRGVGRDRRRAARAPAGPAPRAPPASAVTSSTSHSPPPCATAASRSAPTSGSVFDAFGITRKSLGVDPPHDDVVDDVRVVGVEQVRVLRAPGLDAVEVVGERPLQRGERARAAALAPCRGATRRTRPRASRHARCSSSTPVYWIGISQPPNGTMRAPSARCSASSGLCRSASSRRSRRGLGRGARRRRRRGSAPRSSGSGARLAVASASTSCDGGSRPYFTSRCR